MASGRKLDPIQAFRFQVRIPGVSAGNMGFVTISGLNSAVDVVEYREGTDAITVRKMPGLMTFDNITFTRGMIKNDKKLSDWFNRMNSVLNFGNPVIGEDEFRADIEIDILDRQSGSVFKQYKILNSFTANLSISDLDANSGDAIIETLEVAHEGLLLTKTV